MRCLTIILALVHIACGLDTLFTFRVGTNVSSVQQAQAAAIQTELTKFTTANVITKAIQYFAAQDPSIRNFFVAANNVPIPAFICVAQLISSVRPQIKSRTILPSDLEKMVLSTCTLYKNQLNTLITSMYNVKTAFATRTNGYFEQFPEAVQNVIMNSTALQILIHSNPSIVNDTSEFGPKVKALTALVRGLSESDREAIAAKLPYLSALLLPNGTEYTNYNNFLNNLDAYASGETFNKTEMLSQLNEIHTYFISIVPQAMEHFYQLIENFTVPSSIANDVELNAFIKTATLIGSKYGSAIISSGKLLPAIEATTSGSFEII